MIARGLSPEIAPAVLTRLELDTPDSICSYCFKEAEVKALAVFYVSPLGGLKR